MVLISSFVPEIFGVQAQVKFDIMILTKARKDKLALLFQYSTSYDNYC